MVSDSKQEIEKILTSLKSVLNMFLIYEVSYYLDNETLIGAVRENAFIENASKKIFLALVKERDFTKMHTIVAELRKKDHNVNIYTFLNNSTKEEETFFTNPYNIKEIIIDKKLHITFKYLNDDTLQWMHKSSVYKVPVSVITYGLETIKFYDIECKIPSQYDKYLTYLYEDWMSYKILAPYQKLRACTFKDKFHKIIRLGQHEGKRFKYHCNKMQGLILLRKTIKILNEHDVSYYLDFGTLIGAVREKGFIDWDDDVDISLLYEEDYDKMQVVLRELKRSGLSAFRATFATSIKNRIITAEKDSKIEIHVTDLDFMDKHATRIIKVTHRNRLEKIIVKILNKFGQKRKGGKSLDIFFKYKIDDKLIWMAQNKIHQIDSNLLSDELIDIYFYDIKCKIPKNYHEYLTSMYGDWETPKKDWQYYEEDMVTRNDTIE